MEPLKYQILIHWDDCRWPNNGVPITDRTNSISPSYWPSGKPSVLSAPRFSTQMRMKNLHTVDFLMLAAFGPLHMNVFILFVVCWSNGQLWSLWSTSRSSQFVSFHSFSPCSVRGTQLKSCTLQLRLEPPFVRVFLLMRPRSLQESSYLLRACYERFL